MQAAASAATVILSVCVIKILRKALWLMGG
jgi:hypothetical protein